MMRVCHLNTCPAGVATQDPELRAKFTGKPEHVVNFMRFIAEDVREIMAQLGFRTVEEMVGHVDRLEARKAVDHWKAKGLDFSKILYQPDVAESVGRFCQIPQDHGLEKSLDLTMLLELCQPAIERGREGRRRSCPSRTSTASSGPSPAARSRRSGAPPACPRTRSASSSRARPARASARSCRGA